MGGQGDEDLYKWGGMVELIKECLAGLVGRAGPASFVQFSCIFSSGPTPLTYARRFFYPCSP